MPGGWVEIREHDLKFFPGEGKKKDIEGKWDATKQWSKLMDEAAQKFGKRINMGAEQKELMEKAGWWMSRSGFSRCVNLVSCLPMLRCSFKQVQCTD